MERVWDELKKIDAEAEQIRVEAQGQAKKMTDIATQEAEKLIGNSSKYANEDANNLYASTVEEANRNREEQLKVNQAATEKLKSQAEKSMDTAVTKIVSSVVEEAKP